MSKPTSTTRGPGAPAAPAAAKPAGPSIDQAARPAPAGAAASSGLAGAAAASGSRSEALAPDLSGEAGPGLETQKLDAAAAGRATLAAGLPEETARASQAAAGSALDAPSVGSGPASLRAAPRVPLASITDHVRSADPRELRRLALFEDVRRAPVVGGKLAITLPEDAEALEDYREAGFDFVVTARRANFRRAGVLHPEEATLRRTQDFTQTELASLRDEPALIVRLL